MNARIIASTCLALSLLLPAASARAQGPVQEPPRVNLPRRHQDPVKVRARFLKKLLNARGRVDVRLGTNRLLVTPGLEPNVNLRKSAKGDWVEFRAGEDLGTEAEHSVIARFGRRADGWFVKRVRVLQDGRLYFAHQGSVTVESYDARTGAVSGTFSCVAVAEDGKGQVEITDARFDVKP